MKNVKLIIYVLGVMSLSSCNDFLDKMPDNRAEVNSADKITSLLVSAYSNHTNEYVLEFSSDNVMDNGASYVSQLSQEEAYRWEPVSGEGNDDPKSIWQGFYTAVASANEALEAINSMGNPDNLKAQKAEALLCRAYSMFQLANTFCTSYQDTATNKKNLGLPYPTSPEKQLITTYDRGSLQELYDKINADIETALPIVDDNIYSVPKYHFNRSAAYAFAAKFNLYYMQYDKAIKYANVVLNTDPSNVLRNYTQYTSLAGVDDIGNAYVSVSDPSNLLLTPAYSTLGRAFEGTSSYSRYNHGREIMTYETFWAKAPWGSGSTNNTLYTSHMAYGSNQCVYFPKQVEFWEYTDKTGGTGYAHIVATAFTTDATLLVRAEANALLKKFDAAAADLNYWQTSHTTKVTGTAKRTDITLASINTLMNGLSYEADTVYDAKQRSIKKHFHPQGFTVDNGSQENVLQLVLHCRRLESIFTGERWADIKRYGLYVTHNLDGTSPLVLQPGDLRYAIQIPASVISAGITANPR